MIAERAGGQGLIHAAGVIDAAEAEMLIDCGFTHLGFPLVLDHHAEDLSSEEASAIVAALGTRATFFLITYLSEVTDIAALASKLQVGMVQLHGEIAPTSCAGCACLCPTCGSSRA